MLIILQLNLAQKTPVSRKKILRDVSRKKEKSPCLKKIETAISPG